MYKLSRGDKIIGWTEASDTHDWENEVEPVIDIIPVVIYVDIPDATRQIN